jgi:hypothetical protein
LIVERGLTRILNASAVAKAKADGETQSPKVAKQS